MFDIEAELKKLPKTPGVYMHKDSLGQVIYVGKAVNLRNRVRSYFRSQGQADPKVRAMVANVAEFDYINCATEMEALILESNLIKKYMPKYNILLKDDKTYPYIAVTLKEEFPRVIKTRLLKRDGSRYFGPYSDSGAVSRILKMLDELYPVKKCERLSFPDNFRPCLNYHIGKCTGPCTGLQSKEDYMEMINHILQILEGKDRELIEHLKEQMYKESENLNFEEAAKYRDYIKSLEILGETQRATMIGERDKDVLIPLATEKNTIVVQYKVRDGKLTGREVFYMDSGAESGDKKALLDAFIKQYYLTSMRLPKEILLPVHIDDQELISQLLDKTNEENYKEKRDVNHRTRILVPERGDKKAILDMAVSDSLQLLKDLDLRAARDAERKQALKDKVEKIIVRAAEISGSEPYLINEDDDREYRVEAYDISNLNGLDMVGAMVVYEGRRPIRKDYRKFRIKTADAGDDYGSLQEVIYRRLKRGKGGDHGFDHFPDIFFIDGGLGQVHAVKKIVDAFRMSIPVVGLAKDDVHRTRAIVFDDGSEYDLKGDSMLFSYAGTIQEEVHRFAITFQKDRRGKRMIESGLEKIPGVGPKRRQALLSHFRSVDAIKKASYDQLMEVDGMNSKAAESVLRYFSGQSTASRLPEKGPRLH
ncbi:MAG: excinuclease ABC subunit UvrC [Baileyella intestinalis]|uniref:excinuclease ABC subunit UvrC n=1 Tax=Baileyella intestinalis TaxID=2606709 RepID=UPI0023F39A55|nr:excinuclease ABC subunit UvrC [Baileyella intestinalis]MDD5874912.1 excinuclease ABC subunit UvrC [Baileyella intestinalis]